MVQIGKKIILIDVMSLNNNKDQKAKYDKYFSGSSFYVNENENRRKI